MKVRLAKVFLQKLVSGLHHLFLCAKNVLRKEILLALLWILSLIVVALVQEPLKYAIKKYLSMAQMSWEVIYSSRLCRGELQRYTKAEGIDPFNLNLDDPILNQYYLFKSKLVNKGVSIAGSLRLHVSIGTIYAKILDIKHIVNKPTHKALSVSHSIPNLTWSIENARKLNKVRLGWGRPDDADLLGYNVYRSRLKDVGYGRVNEKLLNTNEYLLNDSLFDDFSQSYYTVDAVDHSGNRSELSNPVHFPGILSLSRSFENVILINLIWSSKNGHPVKQP